MTAPPLPRPRWADRRPLSFHPGRTLERTRARAAAFADELLARAEHLIPATEGSSQVVLIREEYTRPVSLRVDRGWRVASATATPLEHCFAYHDRRIRDSSRARARWSPELGGSIRGCYEGTGLTSFWFHRITEEHLELFDAITPRACELADFESYACLLTLDPAYARVAAAHRTRHGFLRLSCHGADASTLQRYRDRDSGSAAPTVAEGLSQISSFASGYERLSAAEREFVAALVSDWDGGLDELFTAARSALSS